MFAPLLHPRVIVFDWDDVFTLGSFDAYCACYAEAVASIGVSRSHEEIARGVKAKWGRPPREELAAVLQGETERLDEAVRIYEECLFTDTFTDHLHFVEGGLELLAQAHATHRLAIVSGIHPRLLTERIMPKFMVPREYFEQVVTIYDLPDPARGKPYPDMIELVLERMHAAPEDAVMVGDAEGDVAMACAAKIEPVVVLTGHLSRTEAEQLGVRRIIDTVTDLASVVEL